MFDKDELTSWKERYGFKEDDGVVKIYYTPQAFAKTIQLVRFHPLEVGWNMVIKPYKDGYRVEDIVVYPQKASAAYISVDVANYGLWKATLDEDVEANLNGHGHSHVNMSVFASIVDENQQHDEILTKKNGFYLFQIWNKRNEINSFFFDVDNRLYFTKNNIEMIVEETEEFVKESFNMVSIERRRKSFEEGEDF